MHTYMYIKSVRRICRTKKHEYDKNWSTGEYTSISTVSRARCVERSSFNFMKIHRNLLARQRDAITK